MAELAFRAPSDSAEAESGWKQVPELAFHTPSDSAEAERRWKTNVCPEISSSVWQPLIRHLTAMIHSGRYLREVSIYVEEISAAMDSIWTLFTAPYIEI